MSDTPYIPFYTSDFLAGTSGMTSATKGVYITLLCLMYEAEGPLLQKWDTLARRCGCTLPAFKKAVSDLQDDGKIQHLDGGLWSDKCVKHITQRRERSSSAKAAAAKRWEKDKQKQGGLDASAVREQCQPEPEPEPDIRKEDTNVSSMPKPKRKSRMKECAEVSDAMVRAADKRQHSKQEAEAQFQKFKNNALAKGLSYVDWDRAFITWLDSPYFKPITTGVQNGKSRSIDGSGAAMAKRIGDRFAARYVDSGTSADPSQSLLPTGQPGRGVRGGHS